MSESASPEGRKPYVSDEASKGEYAALAAAPQKAAEPAAMPALPEPFDWCYEWDGPYGTRKFSAAQHNGMRPARSVPLYTAQQMQAHAAAAHEAGRQQGMRQEHALWVMAQEGQKIEEQDDSRTT